MRFSLKVFHTRISFLICIALGWMIVAPSMTTHAADGTTSHDYAGKWILKVQGQNFMVLTLKVAGQVSGNLVRPKDFHMDETGFSDITPELDDLAITQPSISEGHLTFVAGNGKDPDHYSMTLADHDHGSLEMWGMPVGPLERANEREAVTVATHWAAPPPRTFTKEIVALQAELKEMVEIDQAARTTEPISWEKIAEVDKKHFPEIVRIYEKYGWPTFSLVGKQAAKNYWLLVQHQQPEFQQKVLPDLQRAVEAGEGSKTNYAYLYDRVMVGQGKPQHWGTQGACKDGKAFLSPVDDPAGLDQRRKELRLMSIPEYLKLLDPSCADAIQSTPK